MGLSFPPIFSPQRKPCSLVFFLRLIFYKVQRRGTQHFVSSLSVVSFDAFFFEFSLRFVRPLAVYSEYLSQKGDTRVTSPPHFTPIQDFNDLVKFNGDESPALPTFLVPLIFWVG